MEETDYLGKAFICGDQITFIENINKTYGFDSFECSVIRKRLNGYITFHHIAGKEYMHNSVINGHILTDSTIPVKIQKMLRYNHLACSTLLKSAKRVNKSNYPILVFTESVFLGGRHEISISDKEVTINPNPNNNDVFNLYKTLFTNRHEYILKEDYNKIFQMMLNLIDSIDKIWADAV